MDEHQLYFNLATALALGLLIGLERGFSGRDAPEQRLAGGMRTYGLLGLLGGVGALLIEPLGVWAWIVLALAVGAMVLCAYISDLRQANDVGMTSEIALLLTFALGTLAGIGLTTEAAACAVVVALLLKLKSMLHSLLTRLTESEITGALKLLFISLVLLPLIPNQGYGPWDVFNPYSIWWMVVLIAAIGFAAYMAIRVVGTRYGLMLSAMLGSLVSSTAMTITLSRMHEQKALHPILASGLLITSALMFPRVLLEVGVINAALLPTLWLPMTIAALVYAIGAVVVYLRSAKQNIAVEAPLKNPFELMPAVRFAALLAAILFLVEAGRHWFGDAGIYAISILSGLTDVDAITLSLARSAKGDLAHEIAVQGIYLAAISNSLIKAVLIGMIGGRDLAMRCVPIMLLGLGLGLITMLVV